VLLAEDKYGNEGDAADQEDRPPLCEVPPTLNAPQVAEIDSVAAGTMS
jgi:hypothetical protein